MGCSECRVEGLNSKIQIKKAKNNQLNFQLILKMNFDNDIRSVKELSKDCIGILFNNNSFSIYNSNTFKKLNEIINCSKDNYIIGFIILENLDLVFWTYKAIYIYNLSNKNY